MAGLRLVTLDVTNTVFRVAGSVGGHYAKVASQFGIKVDPKPLDAAFPGCFAAELARFPVFGALAGMSSDAWWHNVVRATFASAGVSGDRLPKVSQALYQRFQEAEAWQLMPGALKAVQGLRELDLALAVVSNFDDRLPGLLEALELRPLIDHVVTAVEARSQKPEAAIFRLALSRCGVEPRQALHVGNSFSCDYCGALDAGMAALLVSPSPHPQVPPQHQVPDMLAALDKIKAMMT